jgi:hypothetical protein
MARDGAAPVTRKLRGSSDVGFVAQPLAFQPVSGLSVVTGLPEKLLEEKSHYDPYGKLPNFRILTWPRPLTGR